MISSCVGSDRNLAIEFARIGPSLYWEGQLYRVPFLEAADLPANRSVRTCYTPISFLSSPYPTVYSHDSRIYIQIRKV
jgi:hypothetical protein